MFAEGLEIGYRWGLRDGQEQDAISIPAPTGPRLVWSQPANACTRSRRPRPHLAVVV